MTAASQRTRTLCLCGVLHAFTHVYHVALMPLYLLIHDDLGLARADAAPLLVTLMGLAYFLPSYPVGMLADRLNRKTLLTLGLAVNGAGFVGLSQAGSYATAVAWIVVAGFGGSFYHPAATALIARLYPTSTGRALGLIGIGASIGFFLGPLYSGWRATAAGSWRTPVLELGLAGIAGACAFAALARDEVRAARVSPPPGTPRAGLFAGLFPNRALFGAFLLASFAFSLRDFAGSGMGTLSSFYLQEAHHLTPRATGLALSCIFIGSVISNPLFGGLSDRGRTRWTLVALAGAAALVFLFPFSPPAYSSLILAAYGFFFLASYPMVEAALMLAVPDEVRGRVFGLFITIGGLFGNISHWVAGHWVKQLAADASSPTHYRPLYTLLGLAILTSMSGLWFLRTLRRPSPVIDPSTASS